MDMAFAFEKILLEQNFSSSPAHVGKALISPTCYMMICDAAATTRHPREAVRSVGTVQHSKEHEGCVGDPLTTTGTYHSKAQ